MNYAEAKQAIDITKLWAELRDYVATQPMDDNSPMTRAQALAVVDGAARMEAQFADPRFEVFDFVRREMQFKVLDGDSIRRGHPEIGKWLDNRRSVMSDPALRGAR